MRNVDVFISNGSDTNRYRDTVADTLRRLRQLLQYEMGYDVTITNWDYRVGSPTVVRAGALASASLGIVDRSHALVAIFGRRCPKITCDEIRRALMRRSGGERLEIFTFVNPALKTVSHQAFFDTIVNDFGEELVWAPYEDRLSFQATLFTTLVRFLLEHLEISNPALVAGTV